MSKLILKNKSEIEIENGSWLGCVITHVTSYSAIGELAEKLTADNLSEVQIESRGRTAAFKHTKLNEPHFTITDNGDDLTVRIMLKEMTADEIKADIAESLAVTLTDEQAPQVKGLYPAWESLIGKTVKTGTRFTYGDDLYKVITSDDLLIQEQYVPGEGTSAIYSRISDGTTPGTLDEPIDVPADVTTNAFTYIVGKYYRWNKQIYKCERQGDEDGKEYSFVYSPDQLIGQYFTLVEDTE